MAPDRRKPPGGLGRLSKSVLADGFDALRDKPSGSKDQAVAVIDRPPHGLDPAAHPIIARHFFGVEPLHPIGETVAEVPAGLRRQRQIEHVYQLGVRAIGELLREVADSENLDRALEAYARLTPELLKALGGDRFPPFPIHEV